MREYEHFNTLYLFGIESVFHESIRTLPSWKVIGNSLGDGALKSKPFLGCDGVSMDIFWNYTINPLADAYSGKFQIIVSGYL